MDQRRGLRFADPLLDSPRVDDAIDDHGHLVQFYEDDVFLAESVRDFILAGLERGESALIVATKEHRVAIDEGLEITGIDLQSLRNQGRYVLLDARESLSRFMVDGEPEPALFSAAIGSQVAHVAQTATGVRIFGEMVALLWQEGNVAGALALEDLWNELAEAHPFSLLCAYPMASFTDAGSFSEVCSAHTTVIPTERYTALATLDERLRAVTELQQQVVVNGQQSLVRALELNSAIVQGLAAAKMALDLGRYDLVEKTLAETLERASEMCTGLLRTARSGSQIGPGDLRNSTGTS